MDAPRPAPAGDEDLRARLAAGDEQALGEVYDLYAPLVYGLARRVTGDREAAHDVTQEVFAGLWERPLAFDPGRGSLRGWIATLAHRRSVDWVRREARRRRPLPEPAPAAAEGGADEAVLAGELASRMKESLNALPVPMRDALELAYYRGLTYRQVAAALGIPEGTAKSRIRSGLARLGDRLEREGLFP
ncbi:sigma-70 family RNA polymerase sigma factor [Actinomadura graeca]|uniref:Sigma-70 family RNA polymerase sigma factor n=1 Tax=Actinomadura graeca TaxID=2750812 RepID=A0ABX8QME9_9ACTN|nr:sigma-70 family RNA polymerase sigma factor [Actinomadura graeca]QXJ19526.1 sigma-70 family RNA polymerase sigma factor [Actinomadura graeca]